MCLLVKGFSEVLCITCLPEWVLLKNDISKDNWSTIDRIYYQSHIHSQLYRNIQILPHLNICFQFRNTKLITTELQWTPAIPSLCVATSLLRPHFTGTERTSNVFCRKRILKYGYLAILLTSQIFSPYSSQNGHGYQWSSWWSLIES